ncbi:hypothetical protein IL306_003916 [Fusarium sp. DS 682]|nr:hypothetical protein IL306_003916 [Fusarium sp. DS 682]
MAEPIGLTASIASLLDLTFRSCNALCDLHSRLKSAPDEIRSLINEVDNVKSVLTHVQEMLKVSETVRFDTPSSAAIVDSLGSQLYKASVTLASLERLARKLIEDTTLVGSARWLRCKSEASVLYKELKDIWAQILELLVVYNGIECRLQSAEARITAAGQNSKTNHEIANRMSGLSSMQPAPSRNPGSAIISVQSFGFTEGYARNHHNSHCTLAQHSAFGLDHPSVYG